MSLTDKQKASRHGKVGSSDAAVIAEVSPYKTVFELYCQFIGTLPRYTEDETRFQRIGSLIEEPIAHLVAEEQGLKIRRSPPRVRHTFMSANLDFEIVNNPKGPGCLEVKNRGAAKPYDDLPDDITIQVAHQLAVTQREWALVCILFGYGTLKTYEVQRDLELEGYLIDLEAEFMWRVQKNDPPDHTWNTQTVDLLKRLYPRDSGKTIQLLPNQAIPKLDLYRYGKEQIALGEARKAEAEGWFKEALRDASVALIPGFGEVTWRSTKAGKKFDVPSFEHDHPDLYQQYLRTTPGYRRFQVKHTKESALCLPNQSEMISLSKQDLTGTSLLPTSSEPSSSPS